ncbi:LacI family DNA-binding transcriptional regulator [Microbacterium deminutum]|uniref:LacI family DNA-binding transcriptional regulator n=1 Tax=Microbacterium deminutum TaxID=344164 RepID=A0ABP5CAG3_9MICO
MTTDEPSRGAARAGVREVARLAGVSSQTVSRVINDHPNIRPETRSRVLEAMAALDYRVNNAARALGTRTTRTLGIIASDATLYGPSAGIGALEAAAREVGRWVATAYADAADAGSVEGAARHLLGQGVDGIIVVAPHARTLPTLAELTPGVPLATLHGGLGAERQADAAALAVEHLVALGHRRIARLAGPEDWLEALARDAGASRALADRGLAASAGWVGDWSARAGAAIAAAVAVAVRTVDGPTAVAVANDQMALGLIAGLRATDVAVPGDVSVTGFDDNPDAAFYSPPLTTVRLDLAGEARRCVAEVLGHPASALPAPPELVVRESTAAPP